MWRHSWTTADKYQQKKDKVEKKYHSKPNISSALFGKCENSKFGNIKGDSKTAAGNNIESFFVFSQREKHRNISTVKSQIKQSQLQHILRKVKETIICPQNTVFLSFH